ncbi:hypothetical protein MUU53_19385 [Rhizobium lemnae]|uniref:Uncharacterized protein n=1 Tax=Rhizobium lemnae TaxID=1214924 RepID=A0ABV8EB37_9HYPH|nr:hypothetical protein [Rhizobium lemnae]MCJ8510059.1 hypothetical protein [Rhizobium lemnae]
MTKLIILGVAGESQLYAADLEAGTVIPITGQPTGELASLITLTQSGAVVTKGVKAAIALDSSSSIASSFHES